MKKILFTLLAAGCVLAGAADSYQVPVLGDFHYDRLDLHDEAFLTEKYPRDRSQIRNYSRASEQFAPLLLKNAAAAATPQTPFVIQLGDFTEGLCGSRELQDRMFREAIAQVKTAFPALPFLVTKGNHDITGPGAGESYQTVLLPFLSQELKRPVDSANFVVNHQNDAYVFFDAMKPDLDWLEKTLDANRDKRFRFVVTHYPVIPFEYRADWTLFGKPGQEQPRQRLISMLARARAIVLCAHLHKAAYLDYQSAEGEFTQVAHNSVLRSASPTERNVITGNYGEALAEGGRNVKPEQQEHRRRLFRSAAPGVRNFYCADAEGFLLLDISDERVRIEFRHGADDSAPFRTFERSSR